MQKDFLIEVRRAWDVYCEKMEMDKEAAKLTDYELRSQFVGAYRSEAEAAEDIVDLGQEMERLGLEQVTVPPGIVVDWRETWHKHLRRYCRSVWSDGTFFVFTE